jgi:HEAT repeat protein
VLSLLIALTLSNPAHAFKASKASDNELVAVMEQGPLDDRVDAIAEIGERKITEAGPQLLEIVKTEELVLRKKALAALEEMASEQLIEACIHVLKNDADKGLRGKAMGILEDRASDEVAEVMGWAVANDTEPGNRRKAAIIIGKRGWTSQAQVLVDSGIQDSDTRVVQESYKALLRLGDPAHRALAHTALVESGDVKVREIVAKYLGEDPQPGDLEPLLKALDDSDLDVRVLAARSLAKLGDTSAGPRLREKAKSATTEKEVEEFGKAASSLGS